MEIFVTGLGIISSIGNNVEECLQSFENHQSGIGKIKFLKTRNKDLFLVGEVKKDNEELAEMNQIVEDSVSRSILLALSATKEAIRELPSDFFQAPQLEEWTKQNLFLKNMLKKGH